MPKFLYIPPDGAKSHFWLNPYTITLIVPHNGGIAVFATGDGNEPIAYLSEKQAEVLLGGLGFRSPLPQLPSIAKKTGDK
jgi:hypothetical protein